MAKHVASRRGDIDFFLIIAIVLIFIVGASTAGGRLGGVGKGLTTTLGNLFGTEPTVCPFLQKGALSGMLGMSGGSKISEAVFTYQTGSSCPVPSTVPSTDPTNNKVQIRLRWNTSLKTTVIDIGSDQTFPTANPTLNTCNNIPLDAIINPATQNLRNSNSGTNVISIPIPASVCTCVVGTPGCSATGTVTLCCDADKGPCTCAQEDPDEKETTKIPDRTNTLFCSLRWYMNTEGAGYSAQAAKDASFAQFATTPFPPYICILIFGLIPFLILYYMLQDLLFFVMLSNTTKKMIAVGIASMAIVTGAFADLSYVLTQLTNISLSWSFLFMIFGTGLVSIVITNLMGVTSAASAMHKSLNEAHYGFQLLKSFGEQLEQVQKK